MISFDKLNRRAHLYIGLFLMPWLLMYGLSSFIVIHHTWFPTDRPERELLFETAYTRPVNLQSANNSPDLRAPAQRILRESNLEGAFWADKPNPDTLHIERFSFRDSISVTYSAKDQTLKAERHRMRVSQMPQRMHFRGGYLQPGLGDKLWGLLVDIACVSILICVASGLIMWWRLPRLRIEPDSSVCSCARYRRPPQLAIDRQHELDTDVAPLSDRWLPRVRPCNSDRIRCGSTFIWLLCACLDDAGPPRR